MASQVAGCKIFQKLLPNSNRWPSRLSEQLSHCSTENLGKNRHPIQPPHSHTRPGQTMDIIFGVRSMIGVRRVLCSSNGHKLLDLVPMPPAELVLHVSTGPRKIK